MWKELTVLQPVVQSAALLKKNGHMISDESLSLILVLHVKHAL